MFEACDFISKAMSLISFRLWYRLSDTQLPMTLVQQQCHLDGNISNAMFIETLTFARTASGDMSAKNDVEP